MKLQIKISETIINKISNLPNSCCGKIFGLFNKQDLIILALNTEENNIDFHNGLPGGIDCCGIFKCGVNNLKENIIVTPRTVLLTHNIQKETSLDVFIEENGIYEVTSYTVITEEDINNAFLYIRVKGELYLKSEIPTLAFIESFQLLQKTISTDLVFGLLKPNIFLLDNETININENISLRAFCEELNSFNEDCGEVNKKKKIVNVKPKILELNILQHLTKNHSHEIIKEHAPIGILDKNPIKVIDTTLELDSLAMVSYDTKIHNLYMTLLESVKRNLKLFESKFLSFIQSNMSTKHLVYRVYHYYPKDCKHFLTLLYNEYQSDNELKTDRLSLHKQLLLETSIPCFRKSNQYVFNKNVNGPLVNPHEDLKPTENGGLIALVKGNYEYYHYCQNKEDDNGWGCAYRSLQTLASWFRLQGYVDREVPTFQEIQQCLVDIKDKPANFIGSRQWIGSTEVNFVLNTLLGIENKILYVSTGDDMVTKGPELVNHFQIHGSPIMIGGGVLAHTILGVDYNQQTGTIKFLILDPHYTGVEDLHLIQSKGWCGWKGLDFWDKRSYYNMCLPLVPRDV